MSSRNHTIFAKCVNWELKIWNLSCDRENDKVTNRYLNTIRLRLRKFAGGPAHTIAFLFENPYFFMRKTFADRPRSKTVMFIDKNGGFRNGLRRGGFWRRRSIVLVRTAKMELSENADVTSNYAVASSQVISRLQAYAQNFSSVFETLKTEVFENVLVSVGAWMCVKPGFNTTRGRSLRVRFHILESVLSGHWEFVRLNMFYRYVGYSIHLL